MILRIYCILIVKMARKRIDLKSAIQAIEKRGILLVFPVNNSKEPPSLWSEYYPRTKMRWEWDDTGQAGVARLWALRAELAESRRVLYTKWYRGRATLIARDLFVPMLSTLGTSINPKLQLSAEARRVLEILEMDSPLSTRQLKRAADLQGRFQEATYNRCLKELWSQLLIVGVGEVDEGSFPSLAIGSTRLIFEELWAQAEQLLAQKAATLELIRAKLGESSQWMRFFSSQLQTGR